MPVLIRLTLLGLGIAAFATCQRSVSPETAQTAPAPAPAQPATDDTAEQEEAPAPRSFDPDVIRPRPGSTVARMREALDEGRPAEAAALASQALSHGRTEGDIHAVYWLTATALRESGEPVRAFQRLENVRDADHPLAPWARLMRARMALPVEPGTAAEELSPLVEMDWAGQRQAREVRAAALVATNRGEEAEPLLREMLAGRDGAASTIAMPLATLLAARDDLSSKVEAISLWRRVAMRAPRSSAAREAEAQIRTTLAALPARRRAALATPSPREAIERASALAAAMRHADAERAFHAVVERTEDESLRCEARLGEGRAIYYRRERRRAAEHLVGVARDCAQVEIRAWAHYLAGRGFTSAGEPDLARAQYALLERDVAEHSLADDARFRSAMIDLDQGDEASMVQRLTTLPEVYPAGDMRGKARFRLAWRAWRAGDLPEAQRQLEASLAEGTMEEREDVIGRAAYWRAAVLQRLGRNDEAREAFLEVARTVPLRYYGQQAIARLQEISPAAAEQARSALGEAPGEVAIRFPWQPELDSPAFARALALLEVGEVEPARRELAFVREHAETSGDAVRWIEAALMDRSGAHSEAVRITRRRLSEFMREPPRGAHYARWRIAYPQAFAREVRAAAADQPIPPELIFAIAREESSFRPDAVSIAHAYGLTQLILPTARRFGERLGLEATAETLTQPSRNLRIGAAFMSWLWERYESNPVVLPSAYNAGQGATDRWLRERPDQRLDEWIEDIPYDETRRYTRRVLQSWGIYTWLAQGRLPPLRPTLPRRGDDDKSNAGDGSEATLPGPLVPGQGTRCKGHVPDRVPLPSDTWLQGFASESEMSKERRRYPRHEAWFPVQVDRGDQKGLLGACIDGSASGLHICTPTAFSVGERVELVFKVLPGQSRWVQTSATVMRVEVETVTDAEQDPNPWPVLVGLQFDEAMPQLEMFFSLLEEHRRHGDPRLRATKGSSS